MLLEPLLLLPEDDDDFEDLKVVVEVVGEEVVGVGTRVAPLLSVVVGLAGGGVIEVMVDNAGEDVGVLGAVMMAGGGSVTLRRPLVVIIVTRGRLEEDRHVPVGRAGSSWEPHPFLTVVVNSEVIACCFLSLLCCCRCCSLLWIRRRRRRRGNGK